MAENHHTLSSDHLTITIRNTGAELAGIKDKDGTEYLWQAGEAWKRHAPVLFPIVGKLKDDRYFFEGKEYRLSQHGFARDREFSLVESSDNYAEFSLTSDDESKKLFPFDFELNIRYSVSGRSVKTTYRVLNCGSQKMYFSVGAHPAFRCPLLPDEKFTDYFIRFEKYSFLQTALSGGLRSGDIKMLPLEEKKLFLTPTLFDQDALVFENGQVNNISLVSQVSGRSVTMNCEGWPYFGIWSKKGCREFVCLEPWYGVADHTDSTQQLAEKDGIIVLEAGREFQCAFSIDFN